MADDTPMTAYVTQHQIAARLNIDPATVRFWRHAGKLPRPVMQVGGRDVWVWADIEMHVIRLRARHRPCTCELCSRDASATNET